MIDEVQQIVEFRIAAFTVFVAADRLHDVGSAGRDVFLHGEFRIELELLRQVAHTQRPAQGNFPGVRHLLAG